MYSNTFTNSAPPRARASGARQMDGQSGQGEWGQPTPMEVDSAFTPHYPGSGVVNTPAFHSQRNQGGVTSHLSPITEQHLQAPQLLNRTASTGTHRSSSQYNGPVSSPFGTHTPNPSAGHMPPRTPASSTAPLRQEVGHGAAGNTGSSSYFPADPRPSSTTRSSTGGSSREHGSASVPLRIQGSASLSSSSNAHQSRPQCKLPRCEKAAIFDRSINEQREFCEDHIRHMIPVGFAGCCVVCRGMPARLDSEFCSDACRNMNAQMGSSRNNAGRQQQPTTTTRQSNTQMQRSSSSRGPVAVGVPSDQRQVENTVPEGLVPTCQECRRPILKETRTGSRFCGKACEDANRKYSSSSKSRR